MDFDRDRELDPRLTGIALASLYTKYSEQHEGYALCSTMREHSQDPDRAKIARRIEKALDAAFADLEQLVSAVASTGDDEVPADADNEALLREIYSRLHDGWNATAAPAVKMVGLDGTTPVWDDVAALFGELARLDQDAGDGDSYPEVWYEDLLARHEAQLSKAKLKAGKKKAAAERREPPPGAEILDYSAKTRFEVGHWVRHPKFGVGIVVDVAQHATLEFAGERKVLAHAPVSPTPIAVKPRSSKPAGDTAELARAAGVDIKRVPARADDET